MGLAIELGQRGLSVAVVERYPEPQLVPKGQNLTQRTAEHFHFWGCEAELRSAHPIPAGGGIGGMTCYGTLLTDHHYDWLNRAHVAAYYHCANARLPQYATETVLRARVSKLRGVQVFYGWQGVDLSQDADSVTLRISERGGEGIEDLRAAYLVGCDGSHSVVRSKAGISEELSDHNRLMALLVFRSPELHELLKRYPGKAFYNVLHPDFEGYWQFFGRVDYGLSWFFHAPVPLGTTRDNFDFKALLHKAVGQEFSFQLDYIGLWDLRVAAAKTYRSGRIFIAGDAAHSHPPYGGYGINLGFEDARNLGWKLSASIQGWGGPNLLDSYSAERQPVFTSTTAEFIERFIEEDRAFLSSNHPGQADFAERWQNRNLDASEVMAFEPNYEGSPVIGGAGHPSAVGEHQFVARVGHHLAPGMLADGRAIYEAIGPGFVLLAAKNGTLDFELAASDLNLPLEVLTMSEESAEVYKSSLILVRPDQFVAWTGEEGKAYDILARAVGLP